MNLEFQLRSILSNSAGQPALLDKLLKEVAFIKARSDLTRATHLKNTLLKYSKLTTDKPLRESLRNFIAECDSVLRLKKHASKNDTLSSEMQLQEFIRVEANRLRLARMRKDKIAARAGSIRVSQKLKEISISSNIRIKSYVVQLEHLVSSYGTITNEKSISTTVQEG